MKSEHTYIYIYVHVCLEYWLYIQRGDWDIWDIPITEVDIWCIPLLLSVRSIFNNGSSINSIYSFNFNQSIRSINLNLEILASRDWSMDQSRVRSGVRRAAKRQNSMIRQSVRNLYIVYDPCDRMLSSNFHWMSQSLTPRRRVHQALIRVRFGVSSFDVSGL